jgi:AraC-like DNA-binding protein
MAVHWLITSNRSVETIAEDLGYTEARSFTRAFRAWTNQSPSEYKKHRN